MRTTLVHYLFLKKIFIILHCINWPNFIFWLPLLLEILVNMFIAINFPVRRHKFHKFFINLPALLIKLFTQPNSSDKNLNILKTRKAFKMKWKAFIIILIVLSVAKNCLRPESVPLRFHGNNNRCGVTYACWDIFQVKWNSFRNIWRFIYKLIEIRLFNFRNVLITEIEWHYIKL